MLTSLNVNLQGEINEPLKEWLRQASPMSQMSTAPCTPCQLSLDPDMALSPDSQPFQLDVPEPQMNSHLGQWAKTRVETAIAEPQLNSSLGMWAEARVESHIQQPELNSSLGKWAQFVSEEVNCGMQLPDPELTSSLGKWSTKQIENLVFELPEPKLSSQLGQWAQRHVEETPLCIGLPPLKSELGQRFQRIVEAEMWLDAQMKILANQQEYIVDNRGMFEGTECLGYRNSKCVEDREMVVEGPTWGTKVMGTDEGDGWLKVGSLYLPIVLESIQVLTPVIQPSSDADGTAEPMHDGPALTQDGRVVDLDGGLPIFFASDKACSTGNGCKAVVMNAARQAHSAQSAFDVASAARQVDEEAVCSLDEDGVLNGAKSFSWRPASGAKEASEAAKYRLKLFYQKRKQRQQGKETNSDGVLGIEPNGQASLFLYDSPPNSPSRADMVKKKIRGQQQESVQSSPETVLVIDADGAVQDW